MKGQETMTVWQCDCCGTTARTPRRFSASGMPPKGWYDIIKLAAITYRGPVEISNRIFCSAECLEDYIISEEGGQ